MPLSEIPISSLASVLEQVSHGYYFLDQDWRVSEIDPRLEEYTGMSREKLVGQLIFEVFPGMRGSIFEREFRRCMANGSAAHFEHPSLLKKNRWVEVQSIRYRDGLIVLFRDITERKSQAWQLEESEQRFRSLFAYNPDAVFWAGTEGAFTAVNEAATEMAGRSREELLGMTFAELATPEDAANVWRLFAEAMKGRSTELFTTLRKKDGTPVEAHVIGGPLIVSGEVVGTFSIAKDVTETRRILDNLRYVVRSARCILFRCDVEAERGWDAPGSPEDATHLKWNCVTEDEVAAQGVLPLEVAPGQQYNDVWFESIRPEDRDAMDRAAYRALKNGYTSYTQVYLATDRAGAQHWLFEIASVERIGLRQWRIISVSTDITETKQLEEALQRREAQLRTAISSAPCLLWEAEVRNQGGVYQWDLRICDETAAMDVLPLEIPEGGNYTQAWLDARDENDLKRMEQVSMRAFQRGDRGYSQEFRCTDKFGRVRWVREDVSIHYAERDFLRCTGLVIDITDRKLAEDQIRRLISEAPCILWQAEVQGLEGWCEPYDGKDYRFLWRIHIEDPDAANQFLPLEIMPGESYHDVWLSHWFPGEVAKIHATSSRAFQRNEPGYTQEFRCYDKFGHTHWLFEQVTIHQVGEGKWRTFGVVTDVTTRKLAEEELRRAKEEAELASQSKDRFLAALSHELRTPLNPVMLALHTWLGDKTLPDMLREDLRMMKRNVELEAHLIDDLLDLTSINRGKLRLQSKPVDVHELLEYAVETIHGEAASKEVVVHIKKNAATARVESDPARLEQVFWNLLRNAVKFTPESGIVSVITSVAEGRLRIDFVDTGIGIAEDMLPRIFDAFEQGDPAITKHFGGLGLGLTISRGIIEMLGGSLIAMSDGKGKGATFRVELPLLA